MPVDTLDSAQEIAEAPKPTATYGSAADRFRLSSGFTPGYPRTYPDCQVGPDRASDRNAKPGQKPEANRGDKQR